MKSVITKRRIVQLIIGITLYAMVTFLHISLWYVLAFGAVTGIILGKVFCRWMCPLGFIMETILSASPDQKAKGLYNYHKLGCPIAWISGFLNKFSLFTIKRDKKTCVDCGKCDRSCYVSTLDQNYSLFKNDKKQSASSFTCSRCMKCVTSCPTGSLSLGIRKPE